MLARRCWPRLLTALVLFAALAAASLAAAQTAPRGRWEPDRLRRAIEDHYRVVPLRDGLALVPRVDLGDVKSIEVSGDTVAINGATVTGSELRERLPRDADAIVALSYLEPAARKALFDPASRTAPPSETLRGEAREAPGENPVTPGRPERTVQTSAKVHVGGGVEVAEHESVDGPVVAIGGPATIDGEVREDVVAIGGDVRLGPKARVRGDVTAVGGRISRDAQAEVNGKLNEVAVRFPHMRFRPSFWFPATAFFGVFGPWVEVLATLSRMLLVGLLVALAFLIARGPVSRIERVAAVEPWKAGLVGLLTELLFIPVFVLTVVVLAVSIVGIPLLLFVPPLAILALAAALVLGFTGVALRIGRWAEERFHWAPQAPFLALFVGLMGIWALSIAARFVGLAGWPVWVISSALGVVGFLIEYVAWTIGLGAAVITRLGSRPGSALPPPVGPPVVPPPPTAI